ncbi:cytochrome b5 reductase 4 isoform X2 [Episyrphus balteatus]|nr:cytochrome b5 reductase 4 isoform X2 [Episyrphus balteatus]XP_055854828.1 cytochrome b5 reductase 4 isoform X2 [Episyrphus balteatus]XP_055854834.1 cytochrome b5 reductase 4 isoform X2 [Episyrphus balteatus]XP_055854842.1 cytochrome b5 reductase 4 isoform X2 [Episyrphus balteatus]XP_055854850.1 cytochrome b5 reductase 4 isoform X2 [Episyrphus balteatus]
MSVPQNNTLRLQPPTSSLKLASPVQHQSTGSATGNPRNKCALKPGHSLIDWIRLGNSGCDLSGTNGAVFSVSLKELSKHCTNDDAWMAIRGNVYNITRYMDFHPGGPEELMRGVGKDATKLFEEVHAWVNYEQLLKKCLVGPLQNVITVDKNFCKPLKKDAAPFQFKRTDTAPHQPVKLVPETTCTKVVPRFDWIQTRSNITLYFFTKQLCNPGLIIKRNNSTNIEVRICIVNCWHQHDFDLHQKVNWPPTNVKISNESGKIELKFHKTNPNIWLSYGMFTHSIDQQLKESYYEFEIVRNENFNHNSFALHLRAKNDTIILVPVAYHLTFVCNIEGEEVSRHYTPIPRMFSPLNNEDFMDLHFLLKTYENGLLGKYLKKLEHKSTLLVSQPKGNLLLSKFLTHSKIALLAAGSGITPMLSLIDYLLSSNCLKIEKLVLIVFNKTEEDIWCRSIFEKLMESDNRLKVTHILSQPKEKLESERGHISQEFLSTISSPSSENYCTFICTCGPPTFNRCTETILDALNFPPSDTYFFNG